MTTALFTGAGASKAIGYPLTAELLREVRRRIQRKQATLDEKDLHAYLARLLPGFSRTDEKHLPLITDIFSLIEYSIASGESLAIGGDGELRRCRDLLKQAMTDVFIENFVND